LPPQRLLQQLLLLLLQLLQLPQPSHGHSLLPRCPHCLLWLQCHQHYRQQQHRQQQ
jgi:hypothetical protein